MYQALGSMETPILHPHASRVDGRAFGRGQASEGRPPGGIAKAGARSGKPRDAHSTSSPSGELLLLNRSRKYRAALRWNPAILFKLD